MILGEREIRVEVGCYIFLCLCIFPSLNTRDGMSAIVLSFPATIIGVRDDDFLSRCWSALNKSSLDSEIGVEVLPMYLHYTADVFPHKIPMSLKFRSYTTYSRISYPRTNTSSSGLFIVNIPFRFVWYTSLF